MAIVKTAIKTGALKGLRTALMLLRIIVPIYLLVTLLQHTELFAWIADIIEPAMHFFALPGEAVVPIVIGIFSDEYTIAAAANAFTFNVGQATIIGMVTLCLHSVPVEAAIARKIGMPAGKTILFRFGLAIFTGIVCAYLVMIFLGGDAPSVLPAPGAGSAIIETDFSGTEGGIFDAGPAQILPEMGWGVLSTVLNLLRVIIPLMIVVELLLAYHIVEALAKKLSPVCLFLGIGQEALLPLLVGLFLGVTYSAGTLIELNRTKPLPGKDITLLAIFLFSCHGFIETTYLYVAVLGANVIFLSVVRLAIAAGVTAASARLLAKRW